MKLTPIYCVRNNQQSLKLTALTVLFGFFITSNVVDAHVNGDIRASLSRQGDFQQSSAVNQTSTIPTSTIGNYSNGYASQSFTTQSINFTDQYHNHAIAEWSLQQLNGGTPQVNDPWVQDTLSKFTAHLNAQARQQALYAVLVIDSPAINAFAIPGGLIGINAGTVLSSNSMDEVASVMAHEVAHLSQRHYEHRQEQNTKSLLIQAAGMVAAAVAATASEGNVATAILAGTRSMTMDSQMAFSRANEREADRVGMQIMSQAGYDVHAMPKFFAILNSHAKLNQSSNVFIPSFIRTHPLSAERMSEAMTRASQYPRVSMPSQKRHQQLFDLLKWRLKVLINKTNEAELRSASKYSQGAKLALAYWYAEKQNFANAQKVLTELAKPAELSEQSSTEPSESEMYDAYDEKEQLIAITQAQIASGQGRYQQAIEILKKSHNLSPERRDIKLYLADTLIASEELDNAQQALGILQAMSHQYDNDRQVWQALRLSNEVIARQSPHPELKHIATINALRYRSYDELWNANYDKALISLAQAKKQLEEPAVTTVTNNSQGTHQTSNAHKILLAMIEDDIKKVQAMRDFKI